MKNTSESIFMIKKIVIYIAFLLHFSCIDYETYTEFVIKNSLEHEVKIHVPNFPNEVSLPVDTIFVIEGGSMMSHFYLKDGEYAIYDHPFGIHTETLEILYNDTVSKTFDVYDDSNYNLLKVENYFGEMIKKRSYKYTYIISENDFQDALKH